MTPEHIRRTFMSCKGAEWNALYPHLGDYIADALEAVAFAGESTTPTSPRLSGLFVFTQCQLLGYLCYDRWVELSVVEAFADREKIASILSTCPKWNEKYAELGEEKETFLL